MSAYNSWVVFGGDLDADAVSAAAEGWADSEGVEPAADPVAAFHAALDAAETLADVKAALKGSASTPGAEPRRGRPPHAGR